MLLGQKVKCVFPEKKKKNHSHQNHKWTASGEVWCCWTNRDHFGDEHKPSTARVHSPWKARLQGSLEKANSFCHPQGGNDSERRDSYPWTRDLPWRANILCEPWLHWPGLTSHRPFTRNQTCCLVLGKMKLPGKKHSSWKCWAQAPPNAQHLWKISSVL